MAPTGPSVPLLREQITTALTRARALAESASVADRPWNLAPHSELEPGCRCGSCLQPAWAWEITEIDGPDCQDASGECSHVMHLQYADAAFITAWSAIRVLDLVAADEDLLARHAVGRGGEDTPHDCRCGWVDDETDCPEILALARRWQINTTGTSS